MQLHHIGSFSFLHPYSPSFHEMIFILASQNFPLGAVKLERQGTPTMLNMHACTLAKYYAAQQRKPRPCSKPRDKSNGVFSGTVLAALRFIPSVF